MMSITYTEQQTRSIAKTLTIRVLFSLSHLVNGFIVSGSWIIGAQIVGISAVINMCLHWLHERAWNKQQWNRTATNNIMFVDGQPRTISKSITWRLLITINNFAIPYITTGSWRAAVAFLTIATIMNIVIYYTHERIWNKVKWGKIAL
jgi:uncharacterized membrane protein